MTVVSAPLDWVQLVSDLKLPPKADRRLQVLMDRNTEGQLTSEETADLEELVELSETISLVRAEALHLLGAKSKVTTSRTDIQRRVAERAGAHCEYCRMHDSLQGATFHVEHVIPRSRDGETRLDNLAWACPRCNLCKSNRVEARDSETGQMVRLFHPRKDRWSDHFRFSGYVVVAITDIGRATIAALDLNHPRRIRVRQVEERFTLFPPDVA